MGFQTITDDESELAGAGSFNSDLRIRDWASGQLFRGTAYRIGCSLVLQCTVESTRGINQERRPSFYDAADSTGLAFRGFYELHFPFIHKRFRLRCGDRSKRDVQKDAGLVEI
jgi:hypothetical protein